MRAECYDVMYKDELLVTINRRTGEIQNRGNGIWPFSLYLEASNDIDDRVNNVTNFNWWCANRILTIDRKYAKEILNYYGYKQAVTDVERADAALTYGCVSLQDCFWVREHNTKTNWNSVNLFKNSLGSVIFEIALFGKSFTLTNCETVTPDISTNGVAPKAWRREEDGFYLLKSDVNNSVDREVEASKILNEIGIAVVQYDKQIYCNQPVSVCKCYTSEILYCTTAEKFRLWCENNDDDFLIFLKHYKDKFSLMNLGDYLVGNNDRHQANWGFLFDESGIVGFSPIIDFDHAFLGTENEKCLPEFFIGENKSQKEAAYEAIAKYGDALNFDIDYSKYKYGEFVRKRVESLTAASERSGSNH